MFLNGMARSWRVDRFLAPAGFSGVAPREPFPRPTPVVSLQQPPVASSLPTEPPAHARRLEPENTEAVTGEGATVVLCNGDFTKHVFDQLLGFARAGRIMSSSAPAGGSHGLMFDGSLPPLISYAAMSRWMAACRSRPRSRKAQLMRRCASGLVSD